MDKKTEERKKGGKASQKHSHLTSSLLLLYSTIKKKKKREENTTHTHIRTIKMTREDDLYRALGLERTASQEEIRKAYKTTGN